MSELIKKMIAAMDEMIVQNTNTGIMYGIDDIHIDGNGRIWIDISIQDNLRVRNDLY
jgi:hypothetical protein